MNATEMIHEFQCPGCIYGSSPETCDMYRLSEDFGAKCSNHILGTMMNLSMAFALGLPKGFCRPTIDFNDNPPKRAHNTMEIRLWPKNGHVGDHERPSWNKFNIAVWAMERDGFLFVRTVLPRTARIFTDVIEGGTLAMVPNAVNVGEFYDEID